MHFDKNELYSIESNIDGKRISLYDIASWKNGLAFKNIDFSDSGMPVIKIAELNNGISSSTAYTNKKYSNDVFLTKGDFVFSWSGNPYTSIDIFRYNLPDGWLNQHIFKVVPNEKLIIKDYFFYLMKFIKPNFIKIATNKQTTGLGHVTLNDIKQINFKLPNFDTQYKISKILYYIDEKIAINNATNNNLEQQAQAIFKSWFIDFEPFGGTMPNDWRFVQLDEVADFVGGYSYKGNELQPSKYAMATIKNFERKGGFKLDGYKEIIPSDKCKIEQEAHLYDILVAHTDLTQNADVIGNAELLLCTNKYEKIIFSMDVVKVIPKNHMPHFILATMLKSKNFKSHCLGYVNGTTVLHLSKKALPDYIIYIPKDLSLLSKLEEFLKNIYILISNNLNENIRLTQLRDTLLPKLMSGEIDVANVKIDEKFDGSSTDKLSFSEK